MVTFKIIKFSDTPGEQKHVIIKMTKEKIIEKLKSLFRETNSAGIAIEDEKHTKKLEIQCFSETNIKKLEDFIEDTKRYVVDFY